MPATIRSQAAARSKAEVAAPLAEGRGGRGDRGVYVSLIGDRDRGEGLAGRRADRAGSAAAA